MRRRQGLTWVEFLVVIVVIGLVIAVLLPSIRRGPNPSKRMMCARNLKDQGMAFYVYAAGNSDKFPKSTTKLASLCEQGIDARDAIVSVAPNPALLPKMFYCPTNVAQDPAKLWTVGNVSVWGYVWLNDRGPAGAALPATFPAREPPLQYVSTPNVRSVARVVLALDVIVTDTDTPPLNYTPKGAAVNFGTNHPPVSQTPPLNYVNVLFLDGHVESVMFDPKNAVAVRQPGGGFFWFPNP